MRIPIYSRIQDERQARNQMIKAETVLIRERTIAIKEMKTSAANAMKAMVQTAQKPTMTMNEELYGGGNGYGLDTWSKDPATNRRLNRIAFSQSPAAQAMNGRFVDLVYGPRLELQSTPYFNLIPQLKNSTIEDQQNIVKNIEQRYKLWAKSNKSDYSKRKNHYRRSRENFAKLLLDGEYFILLRYSQSRKRNPLTIQYIKPENIQATSSIPSPGNIIVNGIEYNSTDEEIAYHVLSPLSGKSTRVLKESSRSGRVFVIHNTLGEGPRGEGLLTGIISELTKLSDFQALEIQAAVINAIFAVWVETEIGGETKPIVSKQGINRTTTSSTNTREPWNGAQFQADMNSTEFNQGGVIAQNLGEGQKLHSFDTKRPTANFEQFMKTVKRNLYAAKGAAQSVVDYDLEASYSAIRGTLLLMWNRVMTMRFDHSNDYENIIYKMWLLGEVDNGNVVDYGFSDEFTFEAFSNAWFTGPQRPDIDPKRSAEAAKIDDEMSYKTAAEITAERGGGDFDENVKRKVSENIARAEANKPVVELEKTSFSNAKTESKSVSVTEGQ